MICIKQNRKDVTMSTKGNLKFFEIGYPMIDEHHKELFDKLEILSKACEKGRNIYHIKNLFTYLKEYVLIHFDIEEELQIKYNYPGYLMHKAYHEDFKEMVLQIEKKFDDTSLNTRLIIKSIDQLSEWLINHLEIEDTRMVKFFKSHDTTKNP